jgi:hypothetical protein
MIDYLDTSQLPMLFALKDRCNAFYRSARLSESAVVPVQQ